MTHADVDAVIFDCDGTLVDSEMISNQVLSEYITELGLMMEAEEAFRMFAGGNFSHSMQILAARLGKPLPSDFVEEFRRRQAIRLRSSLRPIPGAADLLSRMIRPFSIASNAPIEKVELCLEVTGLKYHVPDDFIFSAYQLSKWKPDPDLFLHAADAMGVAPHRCVVVEDSISGIRAGLAAGMQVIVLESTLEVRSEELPVHRVSSLDEAGRLIGNMVSG